MKKTFCKIVVLSVLISNKVTAQNQYPESKTSDVKEVFFGTTIYDPYRWIEEVNNTEVVEWLKKQTEFTNNKLSKISGQGKLINELKEIDQMRSISYFPIAKAGGMYFYKKRLPNDQVSKLYYRKNEKSEEVLLFDPQNYVQGKTFDFTPVISDDGSRILMNLSEEGSEVGDIKILEVSTRTFLEDVIPHSSGIFVGGTNNEILYCQTKGYDVHDEEHALNIPLKLHEIGKSIEQDKLIVSSGHNPEFNMLPQDIPDIRVFENSPYMIFGKFSVEPNYTLFFAPKSELKKDKINWKPLVTVEDQVRQYFVRNSSIYFVTVDKNSQFQLIERSLDKPDLKNEKIIIEGNKEWQFSPYFLAETKDFLVFNRTQNELITKTFTYEFKTGKISQMEIPLKGNIIPFSYSSSENEVYLANISWVFPYNFYAYDLNKQKISDGLFNVKLQYPNLNNLTFEEIEVTSWDGVKVPLSIIYDKTKLKKDGSNITYMTGYGAYGMTTDLPNFNEYDLPLLNRGVIIVHAHVRGGGEKGEEWYLGGKKSTKPNTWKDFNACAEWLIKNKYTSAEKLGITSSSAGGILIGRAITERPDLYKVAIPKVGCLNMLRNEFLPSGPANIPEFGTVEIEEDFKNLLEMDAYQHIENGVKYPAQLITAGINDPRVEYFIPAKFAAKMQKANASNNPVLLWIDYEGGHFGAETVDQQFKQLATEMSFLLWQCGDKEFQVLK